MNLERKLGQRHIEQHHSTEHGRRLEALEKDPKTALQAFVLEAGIRAMQESAETDLAAEKLA
jgi:hypothetical protein